MADYINYPTDIIRDGHDDFLANRTIDENPYRNSGERKRELWRQGWLAHAKTVGLRDGMTRYSDLTAKLKRPRITMPDTIQDPTSDPAPPVLTPDQQADIERRVERALSAITEHTDYDPDAGETDVETYASDLIADLLHLVAAHGGSTSTAIWRATMHYEAEINGEY